MTARRRRRIPWRLLAIGFLVVAGLGFGAVATDAGGMGEKFERLIIKVEDFLAGPVPERSTEPTITLTPPPSLAAATPTPTPRPSGAPSPRPTPTPTPLVRVPVDVTIVDDPEAVFAHEVREDWCAPAGVQMVLAAHGVGNTSDDFQREIAGRVREWESRADSLNGRWGPAAMVLALEAYGVPGYEIHAWTTRGDAIRDAAQAITRTNAPAILLAWKGAHTWIMTGYRADADPMVFPDAVMTGAYVLDPWYPWVSTIWGPSDPPGTFQDDAEMRRNFLPWKRPEGAYPDRDGKWIIVVPTIPIGGG